MGCLRPPQAQTLNLTMSRWSNSKGKTTGRRDKGLPRQYASYNKLRTQTLHQRANTCSYPHCRYKDYTRTESGLQYQDLRLGQGQEPMSGSTVSIDWDGYTIGYYVSLPGSLKCCHYYRGIGFDCTALQGRPFQARNKASINSLCFTSSACVQHQILGVNVDNLQAIKGWSLRDSSQCPLYFAFCSTMGLMKALLGQNSF